MKLRGRGLALSMGLGALALGALALSLGHLLARGDQRVLPVDAATHFDAAYRTRAAGYAALGYSTWAANTILRWGALAALVAIGGGSTLAATARRVARGRRLATAFLTAVFLLVGLAVVALPLSWQGYRIERAYGLSTQTSGAWLLDFARRQGFWILVYAAIAAGFLACLRRWPERGWRVAAAAGILVTMAGVLLAPLVVDPLFNDFRPLNDGALEREIVDIGRRAGLDIGRVRVMDASRRTRRLNAYVTGLGATQQVVLYDTLLERAPRPETLLVVAHEMGHRIRHHLRRGLLWAVPGIVVGAWLLGLFARRRAQDDARLDGAGDPAGLPLLWLAVSLALFLLNPLGSSLARRMEAEADWLSLELTEDPGTFVATQERLTRANLAPVDPPRWIVTWFYTHPPVLERIGMADYWAERR